jgi:hypothetical protein
MSPFYASARAGTLLESSSVAYALVRSCILEALRLQRCVHRILWLGFMFSCAARTKHGDHVFGICPLPPSKTNNSAASADQAVRSLTFHPLRQEFAHPYVELEVARHRYQGTCTANFYGRLATSRSPKVPFRSNCQLNGYAGEGLGSFTEPVGPS